tara:strand:- start:93 stop:353 length:261 start_codon:yes stop_codon:yes gene_type:complete
MRAAISCLNQWQIFTAERQRLRSFIKRLMGSQELKQIASGFFLWRKNCFELTSSELVIKIKQLEGLLESANSQNDQLTVDLQQVRV